MKKISLTLCFFMLISLGLVFAEETAVEPIDERWRYDENSTLHNPQTEHMGLKQPNFKTRTEVTIPGLDLTQQPETVPLEKEYPLSSNYMLDGRAPLVGGVARSYDERKPNVLKTVDLSDYINDNNKTIRSITDEIFWDYDKSYATINTPKSQAVTGLLSKFRKIDLDDVRFVCRTDYATILVISLDGLPIKESKKILVQAMTEETAYGYKEVAELDANGNDIGRRKITNIGSYPLSVKKIDAQVELLNLSGEVKRISALDEHGYMKRQLKWKANDSGGIILTLPQDSIYTVVEIDEIDEKATLKASGGLVEGLDYVWLEGEDVDETYKFENYTFGVHEIPDTMHLLSNSDWLTNAGDWTDEDTADPPTAKWEFEILDDGGVYNFYVRKFWYWGPFEYRVDDGEWHTLPYRVSLLDLTPLKRHLEANWVANGTIEVHGKGKHTFELRQLPVDSGNKAFGLDVIVLSKVSFTPNASLRPGQKMGTVNSPDWWAFEPDYDEYTDDALLDMRYLMNEDEAGETGFVYMKDGRFYYPNGERMNFWAVNTGADLIDGGIANIDYFAKKMSKFGVNLVRLHGKAFTFDGAILPDKLKNYQLFVAACKQAGIYVESSQYFVLWQDLSQSEIFKFQGEGPDGLIGFLGYQKEGYGFRIWNKQMQGLQRDEFKQLLTSPNPYGVPLLNEPTLAMIEIENEDSMFFGTWWGWRIADDQNLIFRKMFGDWLIKKHGSIKNARKAWGNKEPSTDAQFKDNFDRGLVDIPGVNFLGNRWGVKDSVVWNRSFDALEFAMEVQKDYYDSQHKYLKEDLGWRGITIGGNWMTTNDQQMDVIERWTYSGTDVTDRHAYNQYRTMINEQQKYMVQAGDIYIDRTTLESPQNMAMKAVQTLGKATSISEIAWVAPTQYRAEAPFLQAAYGALQGHDMVYSFSSKVDWNTSLQEKWPANVPTMLGQYPGFSLMYRRGDVTESQLVALEVIHYDQMATLKGSRIYNGSMIDSLRAAMN